MGDQSQGPDEIKILRENLITTAITFLQNDKVRQSPFAQRKLFLEKKGLTKEEIDEAVKRSGTAGDETNLIPPSAIPNQPGMVPSQPGMALSLPQQPPVSAWVRIRDTLTAVLLFTGTTFSLYQLFKMYIVPFFFGPPKRKQSIDDRLEIISSSTEELNRSVKEVINSVADLQRQLIQRQDQMIEKINTTPKQSSDGFGANDIKDELKSLKALLLSRNQFAPVPSVTPIIPSWQLQERPQVRSEKENTTDLTDVQAPELSTNSEMDGRVEEKVSNMIVGDGVLEKIGDQNADDGIKVDMNGEEKQFDEGEELVVNGLNHEASSSGNQDNGVVAYGE